MHSRWEGPWQMPASGEVVLEAPGRGPWAAVVVAEDRAADPLKPRPERP